MKILKFQRDDLLVEIEVPSQEYWDGLRPREQHAHVNKAFELAAKDAGEKTQHVTIKKAENAMSTETPEQRIEKLTVEFMKGAHVAVEKYLEFFNNGLDVFKAENPGKSINDFTETETGSQLKEAYEKYRTVMQNGPVEAFTKALNDEAETIAKDIAKQVEAFSVQHNLDANVARDRLRAISPSFHALEKRQGELPAEHRNAIAKAARIAKNWCDARTAELQKSALDDASAQSEKRRTQSMTPVEKKFDGCVTEIMKSRKLDRPAATSWAIENDATARALYEVSRDERTNGARS